MTNLHLQKHMAYHIRYMSLTFSQVNYPHREVGEWPSPSDIQIWSFKGVCHAQIVSNCPKSLQTHGISWKFPLDLSRQNVAGEYYSHVLEYFLGPNMII